MDNIHHCGASLLQLFDVRCSGAISGDALEWAGYDHKWSGTSMSETSQKYVFAYPDKGCDVQKFFLKIFVFA